MTIKELELYKFGDYVKAKAFHHKNKLGYITRDTSGMIYYRVQIVFDLNLNKPCDLNFPFKSNEIELATEEEAYIINKLMVFS